MAITPALMIEIGIVGQALTTLIAGISYFSLYKNNSHKNDAYSYLIKSIIYLVSTSISIWIIISFLNNFSWDSLGFAISATLIGCIGALTKPKIVFDKFRQFAIFLRPEPTTVVIISLSLFALSLGALLFAAVYGIFEPHSSTSNNTLVYGFILVGTVTTIITLPFMARQITTKQYQQVANAVRQEDDLFAQLVEGETIDINAHINRTLGEMKGFYTSVKAQANASFIISVLSIIIGLVLIALAIINSVLLKSPDTTLSLISGISGIFLEYIGGSAFLLHTRSTKQMDLYMKHLKETEKLAWSIHLTQELEGEEKQKALSKIIDKLLENPS